MKANLNEGNIICQVENIQTNTILIAILLISFFLFRIISNKNSCSDEERELKRKRAEQYLNTYQRENEEFFFGSWKEIQKCLINFLYVKKLCDKL